ncbi:AAA family ATPase [Streptomyces sp. LHD-70]|uniref:ATP-binding protein n=1 Tax=Streptomyces sp. LHD-70 TaxID=3072140 RepID=UPI0028103D37|nr:AAA family ATPase [Streptomyces sp. LHD-70]MDQ8703523.1 AAA family ATPase [Streptomyces sp. LHD-70]
MTSIFVDRVETLDVLGGVAERLARGDGSFLVLEAETGMGKSASLEEFRDRSEGGPCRVVLVRGTPGIGTRRPYGPFVDAVSELHVSDERGARRSWWARLMGQGAMAAAPDVLSAMVPGLGAAFAAGRSVAQAAVSTGSIPGDSLLPLQSALSLRWMEVLLEKAREGAPLLLIIDDFQRCDEASLEVLDLLLSRLEGEPLGIVLGLGTYASESGNGKVVENLLDVWQARYPQLMDRHSLPALPGWAVGELVQARLGGHVVPDGFAERLADVTGGRPVFVEQCLRLWRPGYGTEVPLPDELPAAVEDRLQRLGPQERELLTVGATMGEFFFSHTLAEVTGLPLTQVQDLLHRIQHEHGLVRERSRRDMPGWAAALHVDWFDFEHRVLQHGIRAGQSEGARLGRHARIAGALAALPRDALTSLPREVQVMIADQLRAAGPACAAQSAAAHFELARSCAVEDLAFAQAEQYCRTAIDAARQLPEQHSDRDRRLVEAIELLLSLTEVRWRGHSAQDDPSGIDALATEAEGAARRLGDRLLIARTTLLRGKTLMAVRGLRPSLDKLEEAVARARECGEGGVTTLFVALVEYGRQLPKLNLRDGLRILFEAEQLYASAPQLGETGNPVLQHARNLNEMQIGVNLYDSGRFTEALHRLEHCVDRLDSDTPQAELPIALNYLAQLHLAMGAYEEARAVLLRALEVEGDSSARSGWYAYNSALLALLVARVPERADEALQRMRDAWTQTQESSLANLVPIVRNLYVEVLLETGRDLRLAEQLARDTLVETETTAMVRSTIAAHGLRSRIHLATGDTGRAADDARRALALLEQYGEMPALRTEEVLHDAARALAAHGEGVEAADLFERAREEVLRKANGIADEQRRAHYLTAVPLNRALFRDAPSHPDTVRDQGRTGQEQE